ncbi:MAG: PAS domain S-box protein [bacterium]|nr:PAS domain S-box protein [bacterium]MDT8365869.1 PAS domain S-box protein [bacterium]
MNYSILSKILDASPDMYLIIDGNGVLIDFKPSPNFEPALPPGEFLGKTIGQVLPEELAKTGLLRTREVLDTGKECLLEYSLPIDGKLNFYEARLTLFDEKQVLVIIRDVTDKKRSMEAAKALIDASTDWFFLLDRQGYILSINQSAADIFGKRREQMEGTLYWDHLSPEKARYRKERMEEILKTGKPTSLVDLSDDRVFEASLNPVAEPGGPVHLVAYFIKDITDQVKAEKDRIESEARHRRLFDSNPVPMYVYDTSTLIILDANEAMVDIYGFTLEELTSMTITEICPLEDASKVMENVTDLRSGQVHFGLWRYMKRDGSVIDVEITSGDFPYMNRPARLVLCQDVTEKAAMEKELAASEVKFRSIVESSPMGIHMYRLDAEERLIFSGANSTADRILGIDHHRLTGLTIQEAFPGLENTEIINRYREVCLSGNPWYSEQVDYRDGRISGAFEVHAFKTGYRSMSVWFLDITEKKKTMAAITESEEKFRTAFITSPDSVNINRLEDGKYVDINEGFSQITGYTREEVMGRTSIELGIWVDPQDREKFADGLKQKGYVNNLESKFRAKDGSILEGLMSAKLLNLKQEPHILSITRDITELKKAEEALIKSEEQLRASLGEKEILLKEIHHRVKNNLQVISGLLDLQAHHINDPMGREIYKESQNRVITMALIHEELYQSVNLGQVDFDDYIRNLCENLMISYGADRKQINLDISTEKTSMVVDTAIPCGLIINELMTNALKHAFPDKRKGTISLSFRQLKNKNYMLTVSDNGIGMPGKVDINKTTSLGMQLITVLVGQLGGTLKLNRREGTSFTIKFKEYHEAGSVLY